MIPAWQTQTQNVCSMYRYCGCYSNGSWRVTCALLQMQPLPSPQLLSAQLASVQLASSSQSSWMKNPNYYHQRHLCTSLKTPHQTLINSWLFSLHFTLPSLLSQSDQSRHSTFAHHTVAFCLHSPLHWRYLFCSLPYPLLFPLCFVSKHPFPCFLEAGVTADCLQFTSRSF